MTSDFVACLQFAQKVCKLQTTWLQVLTPNILEEIYNADTGAPCSSKHSRKKQFIDVIKKSLAPHGSKAVTEAAAITCVKLCKAATYINILDSNNVVFSLVKTVIADLKQLLFKVNKYTFNNLKVHLHMRFMGQRISRFLEIGASLSVSFLFWSHISFQILFATSVGLVRMKCQKTFKFNFNLQHVRLLVKYDMQRIDYATTLRNHEA